MNGFDEPFVLPDGRVGYWKQSHPSNYTSLCENGHKVGPRDTRAWVEDNEGKTTKKNHGHPRKYYCVPCIAQLGGPQPPRRYF